MTNRKISVILQREQDSSYTGKLWEITGGKSDLEFKKIADKIDTSHNFLFTDPATKLTYDFYHFIATLSATTCISKIDEIEDVINWEVIDPLVDIFAGWGGDLTTFAENIQIYANEHPGKDYQKYANKIICGAVGTSSFSMVDYIADIDAVNFVGYLQNRSIPEAFYKYFVEYNSEATKKRTNHWVSEIYGSVEKLNQAIDTFSVGNIVLDYLKAKITVNGKVPDEKYCVISANAFKSFILKEMLKNN